MNNTTLNMTTLDGGNVIIKKGTAPAPPIGGESGGSTIEYLDVSEVDSTLLTNIYTAGILYAKGESDGMLIVAPYSVIVTSPTTLNVKAIGVDTSAQVAIKAGGQTMTMTFLEVLNLRGHLQVEKFNAIPRITKEQFYSLD